MPDVHPAIQPCFVLTVVAECTAALAIRRSRRCFNQASAVLRLAVPLIAKPRSAVLDDQSGGV